MISDPWYKSQKPWPFWPGLDGVSRMQTIVCLLPSEFRDTFRSRVAPQLELTARRHRPTTMKRKRRITEAFPWDTSPRYMIRDRDSVYGAVVRARVKVMGIEEVMTAPRSPWQNPFVERAIGSIRRGCLDHVIVLDERHLRRILASYLNYYHRSRTPLSLGKDTPVGRPVQPAGGGKIVAFPQVGGPHHRYQRLAA